MSDRPLSPVERLWLTAERLQPPFAITWVVEGPPPSPANLDEALQRVLVAHPQALATLTGWLHRTVWRPAPEAYAIEDSATPFGPGELDPRPVGGLRIVRHPNAVTYTVRHALMDGRGLMGFVQEVYRALAGLPLRPGAPARTDLVVADALTDDRRGFPPEIHGAVTGVHTGDRTLVWDRITLTGATSNLTARLLAGLARHAATHGDAPVCLHVPVDLRGPGVFSMANCTGIVFVDGHADPAAYAGRLGDAPAEAAAWVRGLGAVRFVPLWVMAALGRFGADRAVRSSRFGATAILSNLGRITRHDFGDAHRVFLLGPGGPATAAFLCVVGSEAGVEITAVMPRGLASEGRMRALLEELAAV